MLKPLDEWDLFGKEIFVAPSNMAWDKGPCSRREIKMILSTKKQLTFCTANCRQTLLQNGYYRQPINELINAMSNGRFTATVVDRVRLSLPPNWVRLSVLQTNMFATMSSSVKWPAFVIIIIAIICMLKRLAVTQDMFGNVRGWNCLFDSNDLRWSQRVCVYACLCVPSRPPVERNPTAIKQMLLDWCKAQCEGYQVRHSFSKLLLIFVAFLMSVE